jgi:ribonuclease P protein component
VRALVGAKAFDAVFKQGRRYSATRFTVHWLRAGEPPQPQEPKALHLGFIIPKRLAKRAARRNQIRRVWRECLLQATNRGLNGHVVVRLVQGFGPLEFNSSASKLLASAVRQEAQALILQIGTTAPSRSTSTASTPKPTPSPGAPQT